VLNVDISAEVHQICICVKYYVLSVLSYDQQFKFEIFYFHCVFYICSSLFESRWHLFLSELFDII